VQQSHEATVRLEAARLVRLRLRVRVRLRLRLRLRVRVT